MPPNSGFYLYLAYDILTLEGETVKIDEEKLIGMAMTD
jgi:hypothetical protein